MYIEYEFFWGIVHLLLIVETLHCFFVHICIGTSKQNTHAESASSAIQFLYE